jgi:hypothetical protein
MVRDDRQSRRRLYLFWWIRSWWVGRYSNVEVVLLKIRRDLLWEELTALEAISCGAWCQRIHCWAVRFVNLINELLGSETMADWCYLGN